MAPASATHGLDEDPRPPANGLGYRKLKVVAYKAAARRSASQLKTCGRRRVGMDTEPTSARDPSTVARNATHQPKPAERRRGLRCYRQCDGRGDQQRASQDESQDVDPAAESGPRIQQAPESLAGPKGEIRTRKMRPCEVRDMEVWCSHGRRPRQVLESNVNAVAAAFY